MDQQLPGPNIYQSLAEKGLKLSEKDFNATLEAVQKGVDKARAYLKTENKPAPQIVFSDTVGTIGFSNDLNAINIRMDFLNLIAKNTTPVEFRDQLVCFVPDKLYMILKYLSWLEFFGMEETIHYYQKHGSSLLKVKFPEKFPDSLSPRTLLLSDLEVEARSTVDSINSANNENPIWKNVDAYFSANFPEYYNLPVDQLITLPKPDLQISFEMENLLT